VGLTGRDESGYGSALTPFRTIGYALSKATPGTIILVQPGTYPEYLRTRIDGKRRGPITLKAQGAVRLLGEESRGRIVEVIHDYYVIDGFEFMGGDVQLWLEGANHTTIANNFFHHAGGECVRLKYHSSNNVFSRNRVEDCGLDDFVNGGSGKNGEGIYLGTAPEQLDRNPTSKVDHTNNNSIRNNTFVTHGNECVDIKEGSERNLVEFNNCTGQRDPESGGFDARGNKNTFRFNKSIGNAGAGIRFGGDTIADGTQNEAYGNILVGNAGYALKVMRLPQGRICGNTESGNAGGFTNTAEIANPPCGFPLQSPGVQ
jgi:hypothetical protein